MRIPTLTTDYSLSELRREARYTLAIARVQSWAAPHVPKLEADLKDIGAAETELAQLQDKLEDAQAAVDEADHQIDFFVLDTVPDVQKVVGKDTDAPLWRSLYGNQTPSRFVRPKLGEELEQLRKWPEVLKAAPSAELRTRAASCEALVKAADTALLALRAAQSGIQVFKSARLVTLLAKLNANRSALGNELQQQVFAGKLRPEAVVGLFRAATRTRPPRPETMERLHEELAEAEQRVTAVRQRIQVLESERKAEQQRTEQLLAAQQAVEAASAAQAEALAKLAALAKQSKP